MSTYKHKKAHKIFDFSNGSGFPVLVFDEKKLSEFDKTKKNVICLVGQARMGKSFFLNCFNTHCTNANDEIFTTDSHLDHCTKDVNIYECADYILIDCQGLKYENSKNDDKLLLIAYTLSDIVVINGTKTLDNTLFSYIEPISVYLHFLTNSKPRDNKPVLIFKIMDYQFEDEPEKNINEQLDKLMKDSDDNYQTLRNTLKLLFKGIYATYTFAPEREEKRKFKEKDFRFALSSKNLNFKGSIEKIIGVNKINNFKKISSIEFVDKCKTLFSDMSDRKADKSFDISECDLSKLTAEKRCRSYFENIRDQKIQDRKDDELRPNPNRSVVDTFTNLRIDDTTEYAKIFIPQIIKIIEILDNFNNEFEDVDPNVVLNTLEDLSKHLFSEIVPKLEEMKNVITKIYEGINVDSIVSNFMKTYNLGISDYPSYSNLDRDLNIFVSDVILFCNKRMEKYVYFSGEYKKYKPLISKIICNLSKKVTNKIDIEKHKDLIEKIQKASLNFIDLCNFDANVLIKNISDVLIREIHQVKICHTKNMLQIGKTRKEIQKRLRIYIQNKFVIEQILRNKMDISMTYDQNIIEPIKKIILDDLKQSDNEHIALFVISSIAVSFRLNKCDILTKIITPYPREAPETKSTAKKIWNMGVTMFDVIKFNIYSSYYSTIDFNKLFHNDEVKSTYITKIKDNISDRIMKSQINYDEMLKIRSASKELKIEFISFSNSTQYIHNLLRKKIVPNNGYLLLKEDDYVNQFVLVDIYGNEIKLCDILTHFGDSDNVISFDYVADPNSENRFLKYNMQHIIMNALAKDSIF